MCLSLLSFDGQASLCKRWILISLFGVIALFGISSQAQAQAPCDPTSFACQVELAIDVALHNLRGREGGNGYFDNRGSNQNFKHNFLGLLSFLEKREGVGWQGPSGYDGLPPLDQQLALRLVRNIIEVVPMMTPPQLLHLHRGREHDGALRISLYWRPRGGKRDDDRVSSARERGLSDELGSRRSLT